MQEENHGEAVKVPAVKDIAEIFMALANCSIMQMAFKISAWGQLPLFSAGCRLHHTPLTGIARLFCRNTPRCLF